MSHSPFIAKKKKYKDAYGGNCTKDLTWELNHVVQCLDSTSHVLGFCFGWIAMVLSCVSFTSIYGLHQRRQNLPVQHGVCMFVILHSVAESLGLTGSLFAYQLPTQVMFALSMTMMTFMAGIHFLTKTWQNRNQNKTYNLQKSNLKKSKFRKCMYPLFLLLPAISVLALGSNVSRGEKSVLDTDGKLQESVVPVQWLLGYVCGIMAAVSLCCAKLVDILISFYTTEGSTRLTVALLGGVCGDFCYLISVYCFGLTDIFVYRTLPWTLPRLISSGTDTGIIIQRCFQDQKRRNRRLSNEDANCLISSDVDVSSDGSEEILWMPLNTLHEHTPQYSVCEARVQIISESDPCPDSNSEEEHADNVTSQGEEQSDDMESTT
ncbi:uncharacterized protein LOC128245347 [Mya arenaria]|uniref:uncharacterized protein LOC128245347 n=1 Tax=Mya arenaria TaxID=6604 RepID=UPI0022E7E97E|nr:uncharacterized protein LOC128245347 [Mya arenaria]